MSALMTDDPEGAKRFYPEVFGWEIETFEMGEDEMVMWLVPGYVGGEPQQPVRRDVVATMLPPSANGDAPSPHWDVDFWIADVDAAAAKVEELGGQILTPPYDIPGTGLRQGVFMRPAGRDLLPDPAARLTRRLSSFRPPAGRAGRSPGRPSP